MVDGSETVLATALLTGAEQALMRSKSLKLSMLLTVPALLLPLAVSSDSASLATLERRKSVLGKATALVPRLRGAGM